MQTTAYTTALVTACETRGLDPRGAVLLSHSSNAVYHLPAVPAVVRITTGPGSRARVERTVAITNWLVDHCDYPATAPLTDRPPVVIDDSTTASFWAYYPQADRPAPTSVEMGQLLRRLHRIDRSDVPVDLPTWTPLESLHATIDDPHLSAALSDADRDWLLDRIEEIRQQLTELDWHLGDGLIHGDAWAGNLLWDTTDRAVLGDWDWVSVGPREIDLIPTWHATIRYERRGDWATQFTEQYGHDLATWPGYDLLLQMRDLVQVTGPMRRAPHSARHAAAFRQRLGDIRAGDRTATWKMSPRVAPR